jgi:ElaB/YqjD/DUF883 family membrane-anchored ribosome-binding protein
MMIGTEEKKMTTKVSTEKLMDDLRTVVRDAEALLQATAAQTGDKIDSARARATESLQKARQRLAALEKEAMNEVREVAASADNYVHKNPWQAVGMAAGAGLLMGLLIGRR